MIYPWTFNHCCLKIMFFCEPFTQRLRPRRWIISWKDFSRQLHPRGQWKEDGSFGRLLVTSRAVTLSLFFKCLSYTSSNWALISVGILCSGYHLSQVYKHLRRLLLLPAIAYIGTIYRSHFNSNDREKTLGWCDSPVRASVHYSWYKFSTVIFF